MVVGSVITGTTDSPHPADYIAGSCGSTGNGDKLSRGKSKQTLAQRMEGKKDAPQLHVFQSWQREPAHSLRSKEALSSQHGGIIHPESAPMGSKSFDAPGSEDVSPAELRSPQLGPYTGEEDHSPTPLAEPLPSTGQSCLAALKTWRVPRVVSGGPIAKCVPVLPSREACWCCMKR